MDGSYQPEESIEKHMIIVCRESASRIQLQFLMDESKRKRKTRKPSEKEKNKENAIVADRRVRKLKRPRRRT